MEVYDSPLLLTYNSLYFGEIFPSYRRKLANLGDQAVIIRSRKNATKATQSFDYFPILDAQRSHSLAQPSRKVSAMRSTQFFRYFFCGGKKISDVCRVDLLMNPLYPGRGKFGIQFGAISCPIMQQPSPGCKLVCIGSAQRNARPRN